tara:strand:+ start:53 stop:163 length:111 start_codon:yes stop_codon:yes gene_type:complete
MKEMLKTWLKNEQRFFYDDVCNEALPGYLSKIKTLA